MGHVLIAFSDKKEQLYQVYRGMFPEKFSDCLFQPSGVELHLDEQFGKQIAYWEQWDEDEYLRRKAPQ